MVDYEGLVWKTAHNSPWFWDQYYANGSNNRFLTFQLTLNLLNLKDKEPLIVETGCQREEKDLGAGMSTSIFAEYISRYGGILTVVDNDQCHLDRAYSFVLKRWKHLIEQGRIEFACSDSVEYLTKANKEWDLVYLDSYDYPYVEMLNRLGRAADGSNQPEIERKLWLMEETEVRAEFFDIIHPCQIHCLKEFRAVENQIAPDGLLLIDDSHFPGGGKPGVVLPVLGAHENYDHLYTYQQSLWKKGS